MGRTDAVTFTRELVSAWSRLGAYVTFEPGWESRGNGYSANYGGCVVHHTAIPSSATSPFPGQRVLRDGRPDLSGPLCNTGGPWCPVDAPRIHVVSANPGNHAGASGGRSMGPLPTSGRFNPLVWGHEIDYAGDRPMAPGQYRAALIVGRGVCDVLGVSAEYVRAHAETSVTGKWDPGYAPGRTIDMAKFRRDVATLASIPEDDMFEAEDRKNLARLVLLAERQKTGVPGKQIAGEAGVIQQNELKAARAEIAALRAAVATDKDIDPVELERVIHKAMAAVVTVDVNVSGAQPQG